MGQLVKLDVVFRGDKNENLELFGFDVEDIVNPIRNDGTYSYFDARMIKGTSSANRNLAKVKYQVDHDLVDIAAMSELFILLTVNKRRGVVLDTPEEMIFISSKISENISEDGRGSKFFYAEDGDPLPVEYNVNETIAQIIAQSNSGSFIVQDNGVDVPQEPKINFVEFLVEDNPGNFSTDIIAVKQITYAALEVIRDAGNLPLGAKYLITDRCDAGLIVDVSAPNKISIRAKGVFLVPDFQDIGDYSGLTEDVKGINQKVWSATDEAGYVDSDICFWNGIMYHVINDSAFNGSNPSINSTAYFELTKSVTSGYILNVDAMMYDFEYDTFIERSDKLGNVVGGYGNNFQWGNDNVYGTIDTHESFNCINQKGVMIKNTSHSTGSIIISNDFIGQVSRCYFNGNLEMTINNCILRTCVFDLDFTFAIGNGYTYDGNRLQQGYSDFYHTLPYNDPSVFAANVLTIPLTLNYIGIFELTLNSGATINKIENLTSNHKVRFYGERTTGTKLTIFSHTTIATAVANNLVSDGAVANTIIGRPNGSDFIEYEKAGILNRRYNAVICA